MAAQKHQFIVWGFSQFDVGLLEQWLGDQQLIGQKYVLTLAIPKGLLVVSLTLD
jgi:hypothetical protein